MLNVAVAFGHMQIKQYIVYHPLSIYDERRTKGCVFGFDDIKQSSSIRVICVASVVRCLVEHQVAVVFQQMVGGHATASGRTHDSGAVRSLEVRFDRLVVATVAACIFFWGREGTHIGILVQSNAQSHRTNLMTMQRNFRHLTRSRSIAFWLLSEKRRFSGSQLFVGPK